MSKYYRTVYQVEVLSEDTPADNLNIEDLANAITDGDCSGGITVLSVEEKTGPEIAVLLLAQGSDPGFFQLDSDGRSIYEDSES